MAQLWASQILLGKAAETRVPRLLKAAVQEILDAAGWSGKQPEM